MTNQPGKPRGTAVRQAGPRSGSRLTNSLTCDANSTNNTINNNSNEILLSADSVPGTGLDTLCLSSQWNFSTIL